jgi:cytochrome c-type biogenesis protein CcmH/NrfF
VLLVGAVMVVVDLRRRRAARASEDQANLTAAEEARLAELLHSGPGS